MKKPRLLNSRACALALLPLFFAAGCKTVSDMEKTRNAYESGNFQTALAVTGKHVAKQEDESLSNRALLWRLNHAAILAADGRHEAAEPHWEAAQPMFEKAWENERFSVTQNTLGLFVPGIKDTTYYARPHEGVMFFTYRMLNALHLGDADEARRYLILSMRFRDEVVAENAARVEKRKGKDNAALAQSATTDGLNNSQEDTSEMRGDSSKVAGSVFDAVEKQRIDELHEDLEGYANYANPLTGFLTYLFLRTQGTGLLLTDNADAQRELDELRVFAPRNSVVREAIAQDAAPLRNTVFVFFETGLAPYQEEKRFDVPLPGGFVARWFPSYCGVAYPRLVSNSRYVPRLNVSAAGQQVSTEPLVNFDAIVQQAFDDEWPGVLARQIAQAVVNVTVNAALNYAGNRVADNIDNPYMRIGARIGTGAAAAGLSYAMIGADTHSWELLPKQIHVARLDIPDDRKLTLSFPGWRQDVTLDAGDVMAVWVKSTSPWQAAPLATQFKFK